MDLALGPGPLVAAAWPVLSGTVVAEPSTEGEAGCHERRAAELATRGRGSRPEMVGEWRARALARTCVQVADGSTRPSRTN